MSTASDPDENLKNASSNKISLSSLPAGSAAPNVQKSADYPSNLSTKSNPRTKARHMADWQYKNLTWNEQVAVYEVPAYDPSRFAEPYVEPQAGCCVVL